MDVELNIIQYSELPKGLTEMGMYYRNYVTWASYSKSETPFATDSTITVL